MCSPLELIGNKQCDVILVKETEGAPFKCNAWGDISWAGRISRVSLQQFGELGGQFAFSPTAEAGRGHCWNTPGLKIAPSAIYPSALPGV